MNEAGPWGKGAMEGTGGQGRMQAADPQVMIADGGDGNSGCINARGEGDLIAESP